MNPYSIPTLLTAFFSLFLGILILSKNSASRLNRTFAVWCLLTAYWQGTWTILFNTSDSKLADTLSRLGYSGIIFIPIVFFHFVVAFTRNSSNRRLSYLFYILGSLFVVTVWSSDALVAGVYQYFWGFYPRVGVLHSFYLGMLVLMLSTGLYLLLDYKRTVTVQPLKVNQATYVFVSTVIYSLAGIDFLMNYGIEFYPLGLLFTNIHAGIIAYAIIQYRLLDIHLVIKQSLIYGLLLLALLVPCYLLVIVGQVIAFGNINYLFSVFTLVLFIIVGFLFPKLRFRTEDALERVLFKKRYDYRETLLRSSKDMISVIDLETLSARLVRTVSSALGVEKASLFLSDELHGSFAMKTSAGLNTEEFKESRLPRDDLLVQRFLRRPETLVKEELEMSHNGRRGEPNLVHRLGQLEAEVSLPLMSQERLIGILNLGHKEGREMYSHEDLEVLSTLTNQAAIAIENARLYENLKQSQKVLQRADRLSSLGMLTAGLAHEIRNPLVAIRTFTQLLPERYLDEDFRSNFQSLALKEVDRICGLINDLLNFARPTIPNVSAENINDIVDNVTRILETEAKEKDVRINLSLTPNLPTVFVDKEQMKQVFMNVILNAIQSIEGGRGVVEIGSRVFSQAGSRFVQVSIYDSGIGIPQKDLENIFNPFFTTKKGGSGLGLSITHQIVQEHAGYMHVESEVGQGTTFYVNLPIGQLTNGAKTRQ